MSSLDDDTLVIEEKIYPVPESYISKSFFGPNLENFGRYRCMYVESLEDPDHFWKNLALDILSWDVEFKTVSAGSLSKGNYSWFPDGKLNACFNCVDRHAFKNPDSTAIIYEADEPNQGRTYSYMDLLNQVSKVSRALKNIGVQRGHVVTIYMPMIPEAIFAMLACARIGAIHSVVFAGFSAEALCQRIQEANSNVVITVDQSRRAGKPIPLKKIVDEALSKCPAVEHVLVFKKTNASISWNPPRDKWWHEKVMDCTTSANFSESMSSEDPLFLLYTSGSTGKPKGIVHSTGGYLVGAAATSKYVFDLHDSDVFFCAGDIGWITGHTYVVYGPLAMGATTVIYEGTPVYPSYSRYWEIIEKYHVTHLYTSPTALRLLKRGGDEPLKSFGMKSLRVLGSVGEPLSPDVWKWYFDVVGKCQAHVIDTYWQTETGSHVIAPLAGITPTKPGSATFPFFGIEPAIADPETGELITTKPAKGVLVFKRSWPSLARTMWESKDQFISTYLSVYDGYYFTGDSAILDKDGYFWIIGRVDDVINVSGHRLSSAEIEAAVAELDYVVESAAVGVPDEITGHAVHLFVCLTISVNKETTSQGKNEDNSPILNNLNPEEYKSYCRNIVQHVRARIGPFSAPRYVTMLPTQAQHLKITNKESNDETDSSSSGQEKQRDSVETSTTKGPILLPRTRSGKIMRRILRKIASGAISSEDIGNTATLANPESIPIVIEALELSKKLGT